MKVLLHACCGPCSLEPVRILESEGYDITLAYYNPNIHPESEYARRLETLRDWAGSNDLEVVGCAYDPERWESEVGCLGDDRAARCRACYRLRFEHVAALAADEGYDAIGTTLSVSPYQYTDAIAAELRRAAAAAGLDQVFRDFRPRYPEASRRSRELGMYRQKYCGCRLSQEEAERDRAERKLARKAAQQARREAREAAERYCSAMEARQDVAEVRPC